MPAISIISAIDFGCGNPTIGLISLQTNPDLSAGPYLISKGPY
jgi:16S rRNA G1207 methylase RsmC